MTDKTVRDFIEMMEQVETSLEIKMLKYILKERPEYQAMKAKHTPLEDSNDNGWIKHEGGSVPVDKCGTMVVAANKNIEIKRRDGLLEKVGLAGKVEWAWCKHYDELDIVEFRIVKDKPTGHNLSAVEECDYCKKSYKKGYTHLCVQRAKDNQRRARSKGATPNFDTYTRHKKDTQEEPEKQTLEDYANHLEQDVGGNIDILSPRGVVNLISEWAEERGL